VALISLNADPSRRELRMFAAIWFPAFFALLGGLALYWGSNISVIVAIWLGVASMSLMGFFVPTFIRPIFVGWMYAAFPIGWVISHLILAFIYFFVITPIGLLMRVIGIDPMQRGFDPSLRTYWSRRRVQQLTESYLRQY
jgi:hypothetical protein